MLEVLAALVAIYTLARTGIAAKRRSWRGAAMIVTAGVVTCALLLVPWWRRHSLQGRLADAAGTLIGERVTVQCVTLLGEFTGMPPGSPVL